MFLLFQNTSISEDTSQSHFSDVSSSFELPPLPSPEEGSLTPSLPSSPAPHEEVVFTDYSSLSPHFPVEEEIFTNSPPKSSLVPSHEEVFTNSSPKSSRAADRVQARHRKYGVAARDHRRLAFQRSKSLPTQYHDTSSPYPYTSSSYQHSASLNPSIHQYSGGRNIHMHSATSQFVRQHQYPQYLSATSPFEASLPEEDADARMRGEETGSPSSLSEVDSALGGSTTSPGSCRKANRRGSHLLVNYSTLCYL